MLTKHNKFFYFLLVLLGLIICSIIYLIVPDPAFYIITAILTVAFSILLVHFFLIRKQFEDYYKSSELLIKGMQNELEERVGKRTEELQYLYQNSKISEEQFREAFDTAMQGMALIAINGSFIKVNSAISDMLGYKEQDLLNTDIQCITHPDDYINDEIQMRSLLHGNIQSYQLEKRLYHIEGLTAWVLQSMTLVRNSEGKAIHFVSQFIDITERKQAEEQLKKYSETLTVLLREVNHRVKNNLAALISMLHMEQKKASTIDRKGYLDFLNDLISRIQSLSTVHSLLSAQNWQPLEISDLCNQVIRGAIQGTPPDKKVQIEVTKTNIKVNSNQAHHLTLVINELTTNSIKHAIHDRNTAKITLDISNENNFVILKYKDDGPGFPQSLIEGDYSNANIGFELIRGIVNQSLDGELKLENDMGATAIIKFLNEID